MVTLTKIILISTNLFPLTTYIPFDTMAECEKYKDQVEIYYEEKINSGTPITYTIYCSE